jgi:hypothetical protein
VKQVAKQQQGRQSVHDALGAICPPECARSLGGDVPARVQPRGKLSGCASLGCRVDLACRTVIFFFGIARIARDGGDADHAQTLLGGRLGKRQGSWREAATNFPKELFELQQSAECSAAPT